MIEVKHLKTLQALRNCGSLAAAAATLHQTQSALSHQFSDLEQRLGFRLFVRKRTFRDVADRCQAILTSLGDFSEGVFLMSISSAAALWAVLCWR